MRRPGVFVRFRVRLRADERGFTLIETVIAITVIFASLLALAFTATNGFRYMGFARERQTATGIANQIMEDVRGLAYSKIQNGLLSTDLTGDPNIVNCTGVYYFQSCSGEKIVSSSGLATTVPLVPHRGTISTGYPIPYNWAIYVTNNNPATNPYRVTVIVSWTSAFLRSPVSNQVQVQSLFWSPLGCVSSSTHPFAAPCQPFFFGQALVPRGRIDVSGTVSGLTFQRGSLLLPAAESNGQQEQISQIQGSFTATGTSLTDGGGTQTGGATSSSTTVADDDPVTSVPTYSTQSLASGTGGTVSSTSGLTSIAFSNAAGDTARSDSTTAAGGANVCPPPTALAETDNQPCGGARIQQAGTLSAVLHPHGIAPDVGDVVLAQVAAAAGSPDTTFLNRVLVTGQDGYLQQTVNRGIGTFSLAGMPANVTPPGLPGQWTGYLLTMTGYADSTVAAGGTSSPDTTATISSGSISYWNGAGYTSLTPGSAQTSIPFSPVSVTQNISGSTVVVSISGSLTTGGTTTTCNVSCAGTLTRTSATATAASPVTGTLNYTITINGSTVVNLQISVDFGTVTSKAVYAAAPTAG